MLPKCHIQQSAALSPLQGRKFGFQIGRHKPDAGSEMNSLSHCFICGEQNVGQGVPVLSSHTSHTRTEIARKITDVMGLGFKMTVSNRDLLCIQCTALLNHLDKMESDCIIVKQALTACLSIKYDLLEDDEKDKLRKSIVPTFKLVGEVLPEVADMGYAFSEVQGNCFVCNEELSRGVPLLGNHTSFTRTGLPTKIIDLMGQGFTIIVSDESVICNQCAVLITHLDKLDFDMAIVKRALSSSAKIKYDLLEDDEEIQTEKNFLTTNKDLNSILSLLHEDESADSECEIVNESGDGVDCTDEYIHEDACGIDEPYSRDEDDVGEATENIVSQSLENPEKRTTNYSILMDESDEMYFKCSNCDKEFYNHWEIQDHVKTEHVVQECNVCEFQSSDKTAFDIHVFEHGEGNLNKCPVCYKSFESQVLLRHHMVTEGECLKCGICGDVFDHESDIMDHFRLHKILKLSSAGEKQIAPNSSINPENQDLTLCAETPLRDCDGVVELLEMNPVSVAEGREAAQLEDVSKNQEIEMQQITAFPLDSSDEPDGSEVATDRLQLKQHELTHPERAVHQCDICHKHFLTQLRLRTHIENIHNNSGEGNENGKIYKCHICSEVLTTYHNLKRHVRNHEKCSGSINCSICNKKLTNKLRLRKHIQQVHPETYQCAFCQKVFSNKKFCRSHELTHPERFVYKCDRCDETFLNELRLGKHKTILHRDPHCRYCEKEIKDATKLLNHERRHEMYKFPCQQCNKGFRTPSGLKYHMLVHTGQYAVWKGLHSGIALEEHKATHTKEIRCICELCGCTFTSKSMYRIHQRWHDDHLLYKCKICDRKFKYISIFLVHMRRAHRGFPFNCSHCGKGFTTRMKISKHLAEEHNDPAEPASSEMTPGDVPHLQLVQGNPSLHKERETVNDSTEVLPSKSKTVGILLQETPSASRAPQPDPKMFKCTDCSFKTSDLPRFDSHRVLCARRLPFKCAICEKRFEHRKNMRNHLMEIHMLGWTCHFCNKDFWAQKEFTSHMKTHLGKSGTISKVSFDETLSLSGSEFGLVDPSQNSQGNFECNTSHMKTHLSIIGTISKVSFDETLSLSGSEFGLVDPSQNSQGNFECNICDYQNTNKKVFDDHVRQHMAFFQRKTCKKRSRRKQDLTIHLQEYIAGTFKCHVCPAEFDEEKTLLEHRQSHIVVEHTADKLERVGDENAATLKSVLNQPCEDNGLNTPAPSVETKKNEIEFQSGTCNICSLTFTNEALFVAHGKMHKQKESAAQNPSRLLGMRQVHLIAPTAQRDESEGRHQYVEIDETDNKDVPSVHRCNICKEEFMNSDELQVHRVAQMHLEDDQVCDSDKMPVLVDKSTNKGEQVEQNQNDSNIVEIIYSQLRTSESHIETSPVVLSEETTTDHSKDTALLEINTPTEIQENENHTNSFTDILDRVGKKIPSFIDSAKIDCSALKGMYNVPIEIPTLNLVPYVLPKNPPSKRTYVCGVCGYRTRVLHELRLHFRQHKQKSIQSKVCTKSFPNSQKLSFQSKLCKKSFPNSQKLSVHMQTQSHDGKLTCPYCYKELSDLHSLKQHLEDKHLKVKVPYKCSFCNETFNTKKAYKTHEDVHPERYAFRCDECNQPFLKEKQLLDHKDTLHADLHCRFCGKEIANAKSLKKHELRHIRERDNFECEMCKRLFKTKTGLRHHIATHTGEYKYCCDFCDRGFMSRMMMEEHRSMHTKEERYICDVCGRGFTFQSTYWIHRKWHDNPYPYKCDYCGRKFRHSSLLAVHKRKHTGERPYKCPHCPLTFPVGGTLKRHLILHTGVYPFNCESCKHGFTTRHKYATHLAKIHGDFQLLNEKPQQGEFKMVIREDPKPSKQPPTIWEVAESLNIDLEDIGGEDSIACAVGADFSLQ